MRAGLRVRHGHANAVPTGSEAGKASNMCVHSNLHCGSAAVARFRCFTCPKGYMDVGVRLQNPGTLVP